MPTIIYRQRDGSETSLDVAEGSSVMQAATSNGVDGIVAECGGNMACATCHVYVDPAWLGRLAEMSEDEDAMLGWTRSPREQNSRLSCQITVTPELDGLVVMLPEHQT